MYNIYILENHISFIVPPAMATRDPELCSYQAAPLLQSSPQQAAPPWLH